jgi:hypothetical protein
MQRVAVRQRSKHELVAALQTRYGKADRAGKARLLDEFCAATGYHRKHAIRVFSGLCRACQRTANFEGTIWASAMPFRMRSVNSSASVPSAASTSVR